MSADAQVTALLCTTLGEPRGSAAKPLTAREYAALAERLGAAKKRPADLYALAAEDGAEVFGGNPALAHRVRELLRPERGGAFALAVESLAQQGIVLVTRADAAYPRRWRERLRESMPPVLYCAGEIGLFSGESIAVVGSRKPDEAGLRFARDLGRHCAGEGLTVVSGGARGVDREAMRGALETGGSAVGIVADRLDRFVRAREDREYLLARRLLLVSPFGPSVGFTVGFAMSRNKLLYTLADAAVVVASEDGTGGTWAGAEENRKAGWVPLFVRDGADVPAGNRRLLAPGAHPLREEDLETRSVREVLLAAVSAPDAPKQPSLFGDSDAAA